MAKDDVANPNGTARITNAARPGMEETPKETVRRDGVYPKNREGNALNISEVKTFFRICVGTEPKEKKGQLISRLFKEIASGSLDFGLA